MSEASVPMVTLASQQDVGEMLVGIVDCLFGLGVALANAGYVPREAIAAAMGEILRQQKLQNAAAPRQYPAKALHALFSTSVIVGDPARRFTVHEGGANGNLDDNPPSAA